MAARADALELAEAILEGARQRPQGFGDYFSFDGRSCALGAAFEGIHRLPKNDVGGVKPHLERFFDCLEYVTRRCPEGCRKKLPLGAMIVHLNDDHLWTRERIAHWVAETDASQ